MNIDEISIFRYVIYHICIQTCQYLYSHSSKIYNIPQVLVCQYDFSFEISISKRFSLGHKCFITNIREKEIKNKFFYFYNNNFHKKNYYFFFIFLLLWKRSQYSYLEYDHLFPFASDELNEQNLKELKIFFLELFCFLLKERIR